VGRQFSREFAASIRSLKKFGAPLQSDGITPATFTQERTDLSDRRSTGSDRHSHAGIEFPAAWKDRVAGTFFGVSVHFISLDHLIANKQARGRSTDLEQLKHISKTQTRKKPGLRKSECEVPPQITPDNQQSLKSCALWPASLQTAAQFPKLLHQGEPAVQRLRSRREGWVKKQFVCANVVASRNVFFDLVDCAGKNHSLVAGRLLTNFQVGPHDHGQRQRILENGCIEIAASLASLSNHKCGVIFCIAIFTFIYQDGEVPLSLVNCMANTFAKRSVE